MKTAKTILSVAALLGLTACGSNFEWFPSVPDTTAPTVSAQIAGSTIFNNSSTHVSSLPANVIFFANEAATIYYTTNGSEPTTASASVGISSSSGATGPSISVTNTILKFFGIDQSANKNQSATQTGTIKSP
jgi:hypothetical protein